MKICIFFFLSLAIGHSIASSIGIQSKLKDMQITDYSRPCCNFAQDLILAPPILGINDLGLHSFQEKSNSERYGVIYTCRGGFIDIAHVRDMADWSGHIFYNLSVWLSSHSLIPVRKEGGFNKKSVYFPRINEKDIKSLSPQDKKDIAISITYQLGLMHEIPTSFRISVLMAGVPFYERNSAFSLEDNYSNILGSKLGVEAMSSAEAFNNSMTSLLFKNLKELGARSKDETEVAYEEVRNIFWEKQIYPTIQGVRKRNFDYRNKVTPFLIPESRICGQQTTAPIEIPERLSNGKSVFDYYQIVAEMGEELKNELDRINFKKTDNHFYTNDIPGAIEAIKKEFKRIISQDIEKR